MTVAERLGERIRAGEFGGDGWLPGVTVLAGEHGVSRATVSRAFRELAVWGLARTVPGMGTLVAARDGEGEQLAGQQDTGANKDTAAALAGHGHHH